MNNQEKPLNDHEILTLRQMLKLAGIREFNLDEEEIRKIVPDQDRVDVFEQGYLQLHSADVYIRNPSDNILYKIPLEKLVVSSIDDYSKHIDTHFKTMFSMLQNLFGFNWIVHKIAEQLTRFYEALSPGQAEAIVKKFIPRASENEVLSSTTRSQLHKLRKKIEKYKPLVDTFGPILLGETDLSATIKNIEKQEYQLEKAPEETRYGSSPKLQELRETILRRNNDQNE